MDGESAITNQEGSAVVAAAAETDNSGSSEGTGQGQGGTLLTGTNSETPPAGAPAKAASQPETNPAPKQRPAWKAQTSKELQDDDRLDRFSTISELGKSYLELEGKIGKSVEIPGDNATAEELDAFYKRIGRPEKSDDYEFDRPDLPEGAAYDEALEKEYRETALKLGLTKRQAADLWAMQTARVVAQVNDQAAARRNELEQTKQEVRKLYGGQADHELALVQNFMRTTAERVSPGICKRVEASGLGNSVELIKLMNHFAHRTTEDSFVRNGEGNPIGDKQFRYDLPNR